MVMIIHLLYQGVTVLLQIPLVAIWAHINDQTPAVHNPSQRLVYNMKPFVYIATDTLVDA